MEARKVQLTGGSTYTVSLPKAWAREMKLEAGDLVFFERAGDLLILRRDPAERPERRTKVLQAEKGEAPEHILRKLIGAYVTGYQFIELRFGSADAAAARSVARRFSRMVIGAEIVEDTGSRVLIQDLANPMELAPDKCLRRMYLTARSMVEDSVAALREGDPQRAADVPPRDQDVDRLYWMVAKQYHLAVTDPGYLVAYTLRGKLHHFRTVAKLLERIGDHAEKIAGAVLDLSENGLAAELVARLDTAARQSLEILDKAFAALMGEDLEMANEALDRGDDLQGTMEGISQEMSDAAQVRLLPLATVIDSIGRVGSYAADIAEVAINNVVAREGG